MPLLERETSLFPHNLFDMGFDEWVDESEESLDWYVVYTQSRKEKQLMRLLQVKGVWFYCPIVTKTNRSPAGRVRNSYMPLFGSYVFVCGPPESRVAAFETNCLSRCLEVKLPHEFHSQLASLEKLIQVGKPVTVESKLEPGDPVRIKSGAMRGVCGQVFKRQGQDRLLVMVDFLQQGASVELYDWELELC